jgi:hypothetical protein
VFYGCFLDIFSRIWLYLPILPKAGKFSLPE